MSLIDAPMNAAHQYAANADEYLAQGLIVLAAEEHAKAAELYEASLERSNDESAKRTMRMLCNKHCKAVRELQNKIDKLKEEGEDPSLPQKPEQPHDLLRATQSNSNVHSGPLRINTSSPQPVGRPLTDSNTGDESFMLLGGQRSDPGDAFNQFWNIMQGMLDNLSQPVAFATIPLGPETPVSPASDRPSPEVRRDGNISSDTDPDEPIFAKFSRKIGLGNKSDRSRKGGQQSLSASEASTSSQNSDFDFNEDDGDFIDAGDELSGSFFLIPPGAEPPPVVLKKENVALKAEITTLKNRLEGTERVLKLRRDQDVQLRDSIYQATREAQRALGGSALFPRPTPPVDFSTLNMNIPAVPIPGINTGREAQYAKRVKELEEELRLMRVENEKNKLMIAKFRDRWEKLKDSAKRKKEAKAVAEVAATGVRDRIVEEPEAEEELDDTRHPRT